MNIIPEIAAALNHRRKAQDELKELTKKIANHPKNLHEELHVNLTQLKKNLAGNLVNESKTKKTRTSKETSVRAPRGMRQWMLYHTIKDVAERGNTRDTNQAYFFDLSDIWSRSLEILYRVDPYQPDFTGSAALKEDFETYQSSSRTRISSDPLFESLPERGRYRIVNYLDFIQQLNQLEGSRKDFEYYLHSL